MHGILLICVKGYMSRCR